MNEQNLRKKSSMVPAFVDDVEQPLFHATRPLSHEDILDLAEAILHQRIQHRDVLNSAKAVKQFLAIRLGEREQEIFAVIFLNTKNIFIAYEELFCGTVNCCTVYSREVARRGLEHNAAAIILVHNHPSKICKPSIDDLRITQEIEQVVGVFDIRVLDHIIVGGNVCYSFVEQGLWKR